MQDGIRPQPLYPTDRDRKLGKRKAIHLALAAWGISENHEILLQSGSDRRITLRQAGGGWEVCYLIDKDMIVGKNLKGAQKGSPLRLIMNRSKSADLKKLKQLMAAIAQRWNRLRSDSEASLAPEITPFYSHLATYCEILGVEEPE